MFIQHRGIPTKLIISQLLVIIDYLTWYQIKAEATGFYSKVKYANNLIFKICIFMNIN